ncbi:hypothetical protein BH09BAC4_BH09BAC4_37710 [soil metagenome]
MVYHYRSKASLEKSAYSFRCTMVRDTHSYLYLLGLLFLTGCQWNLDKGAFEQPCTKPSAAILVTTNQLSVTLSLSNKTGDVETASWDAGDKTAVQTGETVVHSYTAPGTYTVKLNLTNRCGDQFDVSQSITVDQQIPPQVETLDPASISTNKATLGMRFTSLGRSMAITEFGYCYSDTKSVPTIADNIRRIDTTRTINAVVNTPFAVVQGGLGSGKVYYVRAYCKTDKLTDPQYGAPKSFTTTVPVAVAPVVVTGGSASITTTSAVLKMTLQSYTPPLYRIGVVYGKTATLDPAKDKIMFIQQTNPALQEYSFTTTNKDTDPVNYATPLEPNTTYYYQAFGVTQQVNNVPGSEKLAVGAVSSFKTAPLAAVAPVVVTGGSESITSNSAVLKMTLQSYTPPLYRIGIVYGKTATLDPGKDKIMFIQQTNPALQEYSFTTTNKDTDPINYATPLEPNTTYYYQAFGVTQQVNNVVGSEKLGVGAVNSFKTGPAVAVAPVVITGASLSITKTSAVLKMTLQSFTTPLYRVGIVYGKTATLDPGKDKIMFIQQTNPALQEYTFSTTDRSTDPVNYATPLEPNTTYYYQAFGATQQVNNVSAVGSGRTLSFKTAP